MGGLGLDAAAALAQIAEGNIGALDWLYEAYRADIYRLAYMMTKQAVFAEDITQDVFLTVAEKAHTYKRNISVKAWLLKITRNKTLNLLESQARFIPLDENISDGSFSSAERDIEFLDILRCLSFSGRQIVLFHIAYGLNHKEISKILGISHSAVRKQYERALQRLRSSVEKG